MKTLEDLAWEHCKRVSGNDDKFVFELDQLRALIEEAVGIVQGDVVGYSGVSGVGELIVSKSNSWSFMKTPLHHNDLGRLK